MNFLQKAFLFVTFTYIFFLGACSGGGGSTYKNSLKTLVFRSFVNSNYDGLDWSARP